MATEPIEVLRARHTIMQWEMVLAARERTGPILYAEGERVMCTDPAEPEHHRWGTVTRIARVGDTGVFIVLDCWSEDRRGPFAVPLSVRVAHLSRGA